MKYLFLISILFIGCWSNTTMPVNSVNNGPDANGALGPDTALDLSQAVWDTTKKCVSVNGLPDPKCNPGAIRTSDIQSICHGGSTAQYRPTSAYTTALKKKQMISYGMTGMSTSKFEEDHIISLELGGDPKSPLNLWPESWTGAYNAHDKDKVENRTHKLVCAGKMDIGLAQHDIATDWVALGRREGVIK